jgi:hypothetical protein
MSQIAKKSSSTSGTFSLTTNIRAPQNTSTTLTNADPRNQTFTLTGNTFVQLPSAGVLKGDLWTMTNMTTFLLSVKADDASSLGTMRQMSTTYAALIDSPATNTDWEIVSTSGSGTYQTDLTFSWASSPIAGNTTVRVFKTGNQVTIVFPEISGTVTTSTIYNSASGVFNGAFAPLDNRQTLIHTYDSSSGDKIGALYLQNNGQISIYYDYSNSGFNWNGGATLIIFGGSITYNVA